MKVVAVVPMKLNNRRLPGKNIRPFTNGRPLCTYVLNSLLQLKGLDEIFVYCSDSSIKEYLPNGIQYLSRPESLDQDTSKMNEVLRFFSEQVDADIYLMTHATAPFIKPESIQRGLDAVVSGEFDSAFAAKKLQDFIWKDGKPMNYSLDNIPRTQDLQPIYEETSGFYIYAADLIKSRNRRIGDRPKIVEVDEIESVDIDELSDFLIADAIFNHIMKGSI